MVKTRMDIREFLCPSFFIGILAERKPQIKQVLVMMKGSKGEVSDDENDKKELWLQKKDCGIDFNKSLAAVFYQR